MNFVDFIRIFLMKSYSKKEEKSETREENYYTGERFYGSFRRAFTLPASVIDKDITAVFKDGVLTITVPKKE
jgi:HSP20 family protein